MEVNVKKPAQVKTISIGGKVCDRLSYRLMDDANNTVVSVDNGYVPDFFPGQHYGDYLKLHIDIETGQITNWIKPTQEQLQKFIDDNTES